MRPGVGCQRLEAVGEPALVLGLQGLIVGGGIIRSKSRQRQETRAEAQVLFLDIETAARRADVGNAQRLVCTQGLIQRDVPLPGTGQLQSRVHRHQTAERRRRHERIQRLSGRQRVRRVAHRRNGDKRLESQQRGNRAVPGVVEKSESGPEHGHPATILRDLPSYARARGETMILRVVEGRPSRGES